MRFRDQRSNLLRVEKFSGFEIDRDHPAGPESAGLHDVAGELFGEAGFAREEDDAVVVNLVARGAQPVAIERRGDMAAIGKNHRGRAVPRLHQAGVVAKKSRGASRGRFPTPAASSW